MHLRVCFDLFFLFHLSLRSRRFNSKKSEGKFEKGETRLIVTSECDTHGRLHKAAQHVEEFMCDMQWQSQTCFLVGAKVGL